MSHYPNGCTAANQAFSNICVSVLGLSWCSFAHLVKEYYLGTGISLWAWVCPPALHACTLATCCANTVREELRSSCAHHTRVPAGREAYGLKIEFVVVGGSAFIGSVLVLVGLLSVYADDQEGAQVHPSLRRSHCLCCAGIRLCLARNGPSFSS